MTTLRLSGLELPDGQDPLGMWDLSSPEKYTFAGKGKPVPEDTLVWQVQLDGATVHTKVDLRHQFEKTEAVSRHLNVINAHLNTLDIRTPAFTLRNADDPFSEYDAVLMEEVRALLPSVRTYAPGETSKLRIDQALLEKCQRLYTQFRRILAYKTWIETDINGVDVGLTAVDWGGDFTNVWRENTNADQRDAHMNAVKVALHSRQTTMQLIVVVSAGALGLALKAGIPGGQLLLLPGVYDYVRDVLQAWKDWRSSGSGEQSA